LKLRKTIREIVVDEELLKFISSIVLATRNHKQIELGASPRAALALMLAAKVWAAMAARDFVIPEDIKTVGIAVLRHRIILTADAEMEGSTEDEILTELFNSIEIPR